MSLFVVDSVVRPAWAHQVYAVHSGVDGRVYDVHL